MKKFLNSISIPWVIILSIQSYIDGTILMGGVLIYIVLRQGRKPHIRKVYGIGMGMLILLLMVGSCIGFIHISQYNTRDYVRDVYYYMQPIVYIYAGYLYCIYDNEKRGFYKTVIIAGVITSVIYLLGVAQNPAILTSATVVDIRNSVGKESFIVLFALFTLLTKPNIFSKKIRNIYSIIVGAVFILQFSRTAYGTIAVIACAYLLLQKKISGKAVRGILGALIALIIGWHFLPNALTTDFTTRILKSITEISSKSTFNSLQDVQSNWRGYEINRVTDAIKNADFFTQLFGFGFGKTVDIGYVVNLGGQDFSSIATFHNGYIFVLLKNGIVGLIVFISFYLNIVIRYLKVKGYEANMLVCYALGMLFLTYTKGGLLRGSSIIEVCLMFGFAVASIKRQSNNFQERNVED